MDDISAASTRFLSNSIEDYPEGIVLPIDKPYRWTSADVIRKIKYAACRHFGKKNLKVGHAGTLDPLATGILLVCIGPATKRAEMLQASPKEYLAGVTFGATTPSYDLEKEIDALCSLDGVSEESVRAALPGFVGPQMQVAPLFSAKSVDGVRAYETARKLYRQGLPVEDTGILTANPIEIYGLELEAYVAPEGDVALETVAARGSVNSCIEVLTSAHQSVGREGPCGDFGPYEHEPQGPSCPVAPRNDRGNRIHVADISGYDLPTAMIRVRCSKGTYIRALARDLGEALGSGAFLSSLRRTGNGGYAIEDALTLEDALSLFTCQ